MNKRYLELLEERHPKKLAKALKDLPDLIYDGKDADGNFYSVVGPSKRYLVALNANLDWSSHEWANSVLAQKGEEYVVFIDDGGEDGKNDGAIWPRVRNEELRKRIIAAAWPMVLEP